MSHHFNTMIQTRDNLTDIMITCWREGRKLTESDPHNSEIYFYTGNACKELIEKLNQSINEEIWTWQQ